MVIITLVFCVQQADSPSSAVRKLRLSGSSSAASSARPASPTFSQFTSRAASADAPIIHGHSQPSISATMQVAERAPAAAITSGSCAGLGMDGLGSSSAAVAHASQQAWQRAPADGISEAQGADTCSDLCGGGLTPGQPMTPARGGAGNRDSGGARTPAKRHISDIPTTRLPQNYTTAASTLSAFLSRVCNCCDLPAATPTGHESSADAAVWRAGTSPAAASLLRMKWI
jgi:hypothetical protein